PEPGATPGTGGGIGRGLPAAARPAGRPPAAGDRPVEGGRLFQRGDRPKARLWAAVGRAETAPHSGPLGGGGPGMSTDPDTGYQRLGAALAQIVDEVCDRFEVAWQTGQRPAIEAYLADVPESARLVLVRELILFEAAGRRRAGEAAQPEDYRGRFPDVDRTWL